MNEWLLNKHIIMYECAMNALMWFERLNEGCINFDVWMWFEWRDVLWCKNEWWLNECINELWSKNMIWMTERKNELFNFNCCYNNSGVTWVIFDLKLLKNFEFVIISERHKMQELRMETIVRENKPVDLGDKVFKCELEKVTRTTWNFIILGNHRMWV